MERLNLAIEYIENEKKILEIFEKMKPLLEERRKLEEVFPGLSAIRSGEFSIAVDPKALEEKRKKRKERKEEREKIEKAAPPGEIQKSSKKRKPEEAEAGGDRTSEARRRMDRLADKTTQSPSSITVTSRTDDSQNFQNQ